MAQKLFFLFRKDQGGTTTRPVINIITEDETYDWTQELDALDLTLTQVGVVISDPFEILDTDGNNTTYEYTINNSVTPHTINGPAGLPIMSLDQRRQRAWQAFQDRIDAAAVFSQTLNARLLINDYFAYRDYIVALREAQALTLTSSNPETVTSTLAEPVVTTADKTVAQQSALIMDNATVTRSKLQFGDMETVAPEWLEFTDLNEFATEQCTITKGFTRPNAGASYMIITKTSPSVTPSTFNCTVRSIRDNLIPVRNGQRYTWSLDWKYAGGDWSKDPRVRPQIIMFDENRVQLPYEPVQYDLIELKDSANVNGLPITTPASGTWQNAPWYRIDGQFVCNNLARYFSPQICIWEVNNPGCAVAIDNFTIRKTLAADNLLNGAATAMGTSFFNKNANVPATAVGDSTAWNVTDVFITPAAVSGSIINMLTVDVRGTATTADLRLTFQLWRGGQAGTAGATKQDSFYIHKTGNITQSYTFMSVNNFTVEEQKQYSWHIRVDSGTVGTAYVGGVNAMAFARYR